MGKVDLSMLGALLAAQRMVKMTHAERVAVAKTGAKARWKGHRKASPPKAKTKG